MNSINISEAAEFNKNFKLNVVEGDNALSIGGGKYYGSISISGVRNSVRILGGERLNFNIHIKANDCELLIGNNTTMMNVQISFHETGKIFIGNDCMFSGDVRMDVSDMHSILDADTYERLNPSEDIYIGNHVWLAQGVTVTKGTIIHDNCIIGAKALATGNYGANTLNVGIPAKCIRKNITWDRSCL